MSGQGYHLAIPDRCATTSLGYNNELDILDTVNDLLAKMIHTEPERVYGGYKEWSLLLLCLTNGSYDPRGGTYPLNACFFGGKLLISEGSIVNLVKPEVVKDIAASLSMLSKEWFVTRFAALFTEEYPYGIPDKEYQTYYKKLQELRHFYTIAAERGNTVVFYTDDCLSYFFREST
jgi:hypothetical protein